MPNIETIALVDTMRALARRPAPWAFAAENSRTFERLLDLPWDVVGPNASVIFTRKPYRDPPERVELLELIGALTTARTPGMAVRAALQLLQRRHGSRLAALEKLLELSGTSQVLAPEYALPAYLGLSKECKGFVALQRFHSGQRFLPFVPPEPARSTVPEHWLCGPDGADAAQTRSGEVWIRRHRNRPRKPFGQVYVRITPWPYFGTYFYFSDLNMTVPTSGEPLRIINDGDAAHPVFRLLVDSIPTRLARGLGKIGEFQCLLLAMAASHFDLTVLLCRHPSEAAMGLYSALDQADSLLDIRPDDVVRMSGNFLKHSGEQSGWRLSPHARFADFPLITRMVTDPVLSTCGYKTEKGLTGGLARFALACRPQLLSFENRAVRASVLAIVERELARNYDETKILNRAPEFLTETVQLLALLSLLQQPPEAVLNQIQGFDHLSRSLDRWLHKASINPFAGPPLPAPVERIGSLDRLRRLWSELAAALTRSDLVDLCTGRVVLAVHRENPTFFLRIHRDGVTQLTRSGVNVAPNAQQWGWLSAFTMGAYPEAQVIAATVRGFRFEPIRSPIDLWQALEQGSDTTDFDKLRSTFVALHAPTNSDASLFLIRKSRGHPIAMVRPRLAPEGWTSPPPIPLGETDETTMLRISRATSSWLGQLSKALYPPAPLCPDYSDNQTRIHQIRDRTELLRIGESLSNCLVQFADWEALMRSPQRPLFLFTVTSAQGTAALSVAVEDKTLVIEELSGKGRRPVSAQVDATVRTWIESWKARLNQHASPSTYRHARSVKNV